MQAEAKFLPKFLQIRKNLMEQISSGKLKPGDRIPSENILPKIFNTSKATAVKAVAELVRDGYITKINGKGSFVTSKAGTVVLNIGVFAYDAKLAKLFETEHPTIKLNPVKYSHDNFHETIDSKKIDVYQLSDYEFHYMASNNYLVDLWEYFTNSKENQAAFYPEVLRLFNFRGGQYAIPYHFSPLIMFHNKNIFQKENLTCPQADWKWSDLVKIAERLTVKDEKENFYKRFGLVFAHYRNRWPFFILQNGGEVISQPDEQCCFDSPEAIGAVRFIADLLFKHRVMPVYFQSTTKNMAQRFFKEQRAAMLLSSYYTVGNLKGANFDIAISAPPQGTRKVNGLIADSFGISRQTKHFKAAYKFINFMLSNKAQSFIKKQGMAIPAIKSIAESKKDLPDWIAPEEYFKFKSMLENSRKIIDISDTRLLTPFWYQLDQVWANIESPAVACKSAVAEINQNLLK
jgi:multiple sugar transport system substrate-binding protein